MQSTSATTPVAIKLDVDTKARFKRLGEARQRAPHFLMREAINQYIDREEKRESFKQEALAAWEHYQTTGLHLTMQDMDTWMDKLDAGQDVAPPEGRL